MAEYTINRTLYMLTYEICKFIIMYLYINKFIKKLYVNRKLFFKISLGIIILLLTDSIGFLLKNNNLKGVYVIMYNTLSYAVYTIVYLGKRRLNINIVKILFISILNIIPEVIALLSFIALKMPYEMIGFLVFAIILISVSLIQYYLLRKTKIDLIFNNYLNDKYIRLLLVTSFFIVYTYLWVNIMEEIIFMSVMAIYAITIFLATIYYYYDQNKKTNETIMLQQESYISSLESMQEDIRKYNHDYKNLLTGALLQAEEGDYEGVQNYLQDVLDEFELKLGKQISKNTQLKKINSNELKGLILSKISEMEDKGIEFHLEVLNEVRKINMKSTDLVRCLGILLDNAIEEVERLEEKIISLVILQEENITTIMVKNPVTKKVNIQSIYEDNFSTKGEKRGLGLSNYREIIENYENIVRETACTEEEFNQVLKIG